MERFQLSKRAAVCRPELIHIKDGTQGVLSFV